LFDESFADGKGLPMRDEGFTLLSFEIAVSLGRMRLAREGCMTGEEKVRLGIGDGSDEVVAIRI